MKTYYSILVFIQMFYLKTAFHSYARLVKPTFMTRLCSTTTDLSSTIQSLASTSSSQPNAPPGNKTTAANATIDEDKILSNLRRVLKSDIATWRKAVGDELQKPLWTVLQNRQMDAILTLLPTSVDAMKAVPTIGPKTMSYAKLLVDMINKRIAAFPPITINRMTPTEYKKVLKDEKEKDVEAAEADGNNNSNMNSLPTSNNMLTPISSSSFSAYKSKNSKTRPGGGVVKKDLSNLISQHIPFEDLSEEQRAAASAVISGRKNVFITGSAGTGKSFLLKYVIQELRLKYGYAAVAVTAPTGTKCVYDVLK
jgi:hypothetical protein